MNRARRAALLVVWDDAQGGVCDLYLAFILANILLGTIFSAEQLYDHLLVVG